MTFTIQSKLVSLVVLNLALSACTTGLHGNFVAHSYIDHNANPQGEALGHVSGVSSQTWFLYIFPIDESPSTGEAINDAMNKIAGTKYLSNITIDDREIWQFGYSEQTIRINAEARN